jgi:hypothetical protein
MRRALGTGADSVRTIWAMATVVSPSGGFEARVASSLDGRVRLALGSALVAGVDHGAGWRCDSLGMPAALDSITRTVVRGHDLHALAFSPGWLGPATLDPAGHWGGDSVLTLRFRDELGQPLRVHVRATDTLLMGFDVINHTGSGPRDVQVLVSDWEDISGARLFRKAVFVHGGNRFEYTYRELAINTLGDSAFVPSCPAHR